MNTVKTLDEFLDKYIVMKKLYDKAQEILENTKKVENEMYIECIMKTQELIRFLDDQNPFVINRNKEEVKNTYYISAELLIRTVGFIQNRQVFTENDKNSLHIAIVHLRKVLSIEPMNPKAKELFKMSFLYLTLFNSNPKENIDCLNQILAIDPCDYQLHYNLGFTFHRANQLDNSLYHYKLSLGILELLMENEKLKNNGLETDTYKSYLQFKIKCYNGIGGIYFNIQDRETALYYFELAYAIDPLDPDINNQIGVIYTELRYTDKAIKYYEQGIENYKRAHISTDHDMLIASMYMNMGLVKCYECDFTGAIDGYNKALKYKPRLSLAYQNKLLDVNYISHLIKDPMYISKLHKNINKIYEKVIEDYKISCPDYKIKNDILKYTNKKDIKTKLNIGFVSGDFICHPVSYFIHSILRHINYDIFNVFCYSVKIVNLESQFEKCKWKIIKNNTDEDVKKLVQEDSIDILIDLSAHTGDNRLDAFVLKPAPIQISYCGYPNSAGIKSMDYRITDRFCDSDKSQKYYQEKFIFMERCFLAYTPSMGIENIPDIVNKSPCQENGYITFGCFNRYNKINKMVIGVWEKILLGAPTARFVIKTKEFSTEKLKQQFLDTFQDKKVLERIIILPYSDTYTDHLPDYNKMDISLDTFPYCGTTTSCESLCMGVPILTLFDNVRYYHSQNVTTSLLKNSNLSEFVAYSEKEYIDKAIMFANSINTSVNLKEHVRKCFVNGYVCNYKQFVDDFENKLLDTYKNHKW